MKDFEYFEPSGITEASSLLAKYKDKARILAGGTDMITNMKNGLEIPEYLINITGIPGLDYITFDPVNGLRIGALTTIRSLLNSTVISERYPIISQAASQFANMAIRNVATVGGNLCSSLPSADTAPGLMALSAKVNIAGPQGDRCVLLEDFFTGTGTNILAAGEILTEIQVPVLADDTRSVYLKYGMRGVSDLQIVGVAVVITMEPGNICRDIKIALGNVAPTPIRAKRSEESVRGKIIDNAAIDRCAQAAAGEAHPRAGSMRASAEYKKAMVNVFTRRVLRRALA